MLRKLFFALVMCGASAGVANATSCDFNTLDYADDLLEIENLRSIDIEVDKYQKWVVNQLKMVTDPSANIEPKYKKKFKADIFVNYTFGTCKVRGTVRQSGDLKDHFEVDGFIITQSLDVSISNGNVAGITKFKMFLPKTRNGDVEVFAATFLQEFGLLSPRTRYIDSKVNDNPARRYIFQEKPVKEFIEFNSRKEGPILEGLDDNLFEKLAVNESFSPDLTVAKMSNTKWGIAGLASSNISNFALNKMNLAYTNKYNDRDLSSLDGSLLATVDAALNFGKFDVPDYAYISGGSKNLFLRNIIFHNLMAAIDAGHGLALYNRKFYWNSLEQGFEPIYYDGTAKLGSVNVREPLLGNQEALEFTKIRLSSLNLHQFMDKLRALGVKVSADVIGETLQSIRTIIDSITPQVDNPLTLAEGYKKSIDPSLYIDRVNGRYENFATSSIRSFYYGDDGFLTAAVDSCVASECTNTDLKPDDIRDLLSGGLFLNGIKILPPTGAFELPTEKLLTTEVSLPHGPVVVQHSIGVSVQAYSDQNLLRIILAGLTDWLLISETTLPDITIDIRGPFRTEDRLEVDQRFNDFGITGCLNFYNVTFLGTEIRTYGTGCEDAVNILNSTGTLASIEANVSFADAIDADFSDIKIQKALVRNIGNDCLDFSYGTYTVANATLSNCGDKAISVGENSRAFLSDIDVRQSAYGVVSKDSSIVEVRRAQQNGVNFVCAAYNKKTEFYGAIIRDDMGFCEQGPGEFDQTSEVRTK